MESKANNSTLKQSATANELKISSTTLQRYRRAINVLSPYRIPPTSNTHRRKEKFSKHTEHDPKMTSKTSKWPQLTSKWPQTKQLKTRKIN